MPYILLTISALTGCLFSYFLNFKAKANKNLLTFSAGLLISITVLDLFPEIYREGSTWIGLWVLGGILLQLSLESLSGGIEHGHLHLKTTKSSKSNINLPITVVFGLFIHSFLEGVPLLEGNNFMTQSNIFIPILKAHTPIAFALIVHKFVESIVLGIFLKSAKIKGYKFIIIVTLFSISSTLGALCTHLLSESTAIKALALVCGIFLHISSVIIFETNQSHHFDLKKFLFVVLGMLVGFQIIFYS